MYFQAKKTQPSESEDATAGLYVRGVFHGQSHVSLLWAVVEKGRLGKWIELGKKSLIQ